MAKRLAQIDKENFGLKLKIHFMEEALRKNGKDFSEAAIKENTELKVDKITLQREMKQYRRSLVQAEKDLEDYRKQLHDYADKVKRRHVGEEIQEDMNKLRQEAAKNEAMVQELEAKLAASHDAQARVKALEDDVADLEADIRDKDRQLDEKDDQLDTFRTQKQSGQDLEEELRKKDEALEDKELQYNSLEKDRCETLKRLTANEKSLQSAGEKNRDLEERLRDANDALRASDDEAKSQHVRITELEARQKLIESQAHEVQTLKSHIEALKDSESSAIREKDRLLDERCAEIASLHQKLNMAAGRDGVEESLQDRINELERSLRETRESLEEKVRAYVCFPPSYLLLPLTDYRMNWPSSKPNFKKVTTSSFWTHKTESKNLSFS